ncbi:MAG: phenylalanyl-tRNA synthetase, beta subunit [Candidatus Berkelbacteria bacterium Licking1014_2]|uniref:Phenylalanine--tRNA ligase beta subunit n=1 Tax=Candidatus Berkelbacteria bacterium Licking1014_2 TaxID=2017146 RepID=A0A554LWK5_9BACT|nr:MAG: phenylalanyl-tRNA synthetase, beta subunit [Candidatus Berkelbacteria bacterium Licking1014_2]
MKYPIDWLKEYTDLPDSNEGINAFCEQLGFAVEENDGQTIDLEITPNRGDCLSMIGLGRDIAVLQGKTIKKEIDCRLPKKVYTKKSKFLNFQFPAQGIIRFSGAIIRGCRTAPSPTEVSRRLELAGIRPLTNIIDITNYVMLELGQPLHAFDLKAIADRQFNIVESIEGEEVTTLDGQNRKLPTGSLIVKDSQRNIDLCGIMGGFHSEITKGTTDIFLQAAIFPRPLIRKTCRQINLTTEASYRYEREIDYNMCLPALALATKMIIDLAGGEIAEWFDFEIEKEAEKTIVLNLKNIKQKIGLTVEKEKVQEILTNFGLQVKKDNGQNIEYTIPSWRHDLVWEEDLLEEIARIIGYEKIKPTILPKIKVKEQVIDYQWQLAVLEFLKQQGLTEVINYTFLSRKLAELGGATKEELIAIANPLSNEHEVMRSNLTIGLLKALAANPDDKATPVFEIGKVFTQPLKEKWQVGVGQWLYTGVVQKLFPKEKIKRIDINHPLAEIFTLRKPIEIAEMDYDEFWQRHNEEIKKISHKEFSLAGPKIQFKSISKFPSLRRDLAIVATQNIQPEEIIKSIYQADDKIFLAELFDEYENPQLGENKKGLAFHIIYQDLEKTMTDETAEKLQQKIITCLADKFKAKLRS